MRKEPFLDNIDNINNDQFSGFCIDLLKRLADLCEFEYELKLVEDNIHGSQINGNYFNMA